MHHLDLGLFNYQIEFTREYLKNIRSTSTVNEMDRRLSNIPRFSGLKIFSHGIQSITRLTANEYRDLMKIMIFVIDNLYSDNIQNVEYYISNRELVSLYEEWNEMYTISRYKEFSKSDLNKFKVSES